MKGRRNIIKAIASLLVLSVIASCLPIGIAFAADRPSNGGYTNFVDDSYSETAEKSETVEKTITASKLVYTTSATSTEFKSYTKTLTANSLITASMVKAYFSIDVYGAYKAYADANPNSVITLKGIKVEQKGQLSGGSSTVNVETGYSINGGMIDTDTIKPLVSAGTGIAINSSVSPIGSVTELADEAVLSGSTTEGMYLVWYVGQSTKAMYYCAPSVTLVFDVYTKTTTDYNNDTTTANGSNGSFTEGILDIETTETLTPETVTGQKFYLGAYNNGYIGSSSYGSSSGQIYTSVSTTNKNPKTNTVLTSNYQKFSIPYLASAYLNYDLSDYLQYIENSLIAQGKKNVKITITSVDMFAKVRMGYTGSYASSYAPYDNIAVAVAPSWSGSSYPTSSYQQTGDYYANYAYNVTVYLATSLTANQVTQLNSTKAFTVRLQSTDYYGYYDYIATEAYLWTLVEDYPTIAINYSYTCDDVEKTVVDNTVKTDLYAEHKFYDANDNLVMGKTKFIGTLTGVGAKAVVTPYTSGTVDNLYSYSNGVQSYSNTSSAVISADEYVLQRAYVDSGDGRVISIDSTSAKNSYTVTYLASTLAQASDSARVVFEYKKASQAEAAEFEYKSVDMELDGSKLVFTVVTSPANINRVKIFDNADAGSYLKLINTYTVNADGNYVWTASIAAPSVETTYGIDVRSNADNKYLKNIVYKTYNPNSTTPDNNTSIVKKVAYKVENGKVVFTVTTAPNVANRVRVAPANAPTAYISYVSDHTVDANGNWVWTLTINAPTEASSYVFDARLTETGKYAKAYFYATVDPSQVVIPESDTSIFRGVTYSVADGKVTFKAVSKSSASINRVRVAPASSPTDYITYVSKYTVNANGDYVWTITIDAPSETTIYAFDARLAETGKYAKAYFYVSVAGQGGSSGGTTTPDVDDTVATFKSVSASVSGDVLIFVITTSPVAINRIKVMNAADMSTNLKLVSDYTVDSNGDYVWIVSVGAPSAKTTYAFDARSSETGSYLKDYFYFEVNPSTVTVVEPEIKSVSYAVSGEQFVFTVTTTNANINRVKVCDQYGGLLTYVSQCTRNSNGDYEWVLAVNAERGTNTYTFYMRDASTGTYIDDGFDYSVTYEGPTVVVPDSPIESVTYTTSGGIVTFKVTTAAGAYSRIKVAYLNDLSTAIAYTDKYVETDDGKYVWTLSVAQTGEDTTYSFDLRSSETLKYLKKYYDFTVKAGEVNPDIESLVFKSVTATEDNGKLTFTVETYKGYNRMKVSLASALSSYIKYTNSYVETSDSLIWTLTIDAPAETTAYAFAVRPDGASSYLQERCSYVYKVVNHPDESVWGTINDNGLYTAINGGYQIVLPGWVYYGNVDGSETVAASATAPTSCLFAAIYDVIDSKIFDNYTQADFEEALGYEITSFRETTVGDGYTCYVYTIDGMYVYTFQTDNARYFLNFVQADDGVDVKTISNIAMTNIVVYY